MKIARAISIAAFCAAAALAQTGSVVASPATPPSPAKPAQVIVTTASGAGSCTLRGDAVPATGVLLTCSTKTTTVGPYSFPLEAGGAWTLMRNIGNETISFMAHADAGGAITVDAATGIVGQGGEVSQLGLKFSEVPPIR